MPITSLGRLARSFVILLLALSFTSAARALTADQLGLVVNLNIPDGVDLARYYCKRRGVPLDHIIPLRLPGTDDISFDQYVSQVVPGIRQYLRDHHLDAKVTCLVTFYGVPLRIQNKVNSDADKKELAELPGMAQALRERELASVIALEGIAQKQDPNFKPANPGQDSGSLARRADAALHRIQQAISETTDPDQKKALALATRDPYQELAGEVTELAMRLHELKQIADPGDAQRAELTADTQQLSIDLAPIRSDAERLFDPNARADFRDRAEKVLGAFKAEQVYADQINFLTPDGTESAVDNELALLWWNGYPHQQRLANPLHYGVQVQVPAPVLMTCRLDGPEPGTVSEMMLASLKAEHDGLRGRICIDSRGILPVHDGHGDPYGVYDQTLRNLADLLASKTKLTVAHEDTPALFAAGSEKDVAVYIGWYSPGVYVPAFTFNTGAVAIHIASWEMKTLHGETKEWCRNLLLDGAAATMGPVDEPFLDSFPRADDFVPLLLTGKLTLAEVYWKCIPQVSWMQALVGDPLYTPYAKNPPLRVEDLPDRLKPIFAPPATRPTTAASR